MTKDTYNAIMAELEERATYKDSVYLTAIQEVLEKHVVKSTRYDEFSSVIPEAWSI